MDPGPSTIWGCAVVTISCRASSFLGEKYRQASGRCQSFEARRRSTRRPKSLVLMQQRRKVQSPGKQSVACTITGFARCPSTNADQYRCPPRQPKQNRPGNHKSQPYMLLDFVSRGIGLPSSYRNSIGSAHRKIKAAISSLTRLHRRASLLRIFALARIQT